MSNVLNTSKLQRLAATVQELSLAKNIETVMKIVRIVARELTGADGATFVLRDRIGNAEACYYADEDAITLYGRGVVFQ